MSKVKPKKTPKIIALDRGLEILELMTVEPLKIWSLKELATVMKMDQSSVYRTVQTLAARGFIRQASEGIGYVLGFQAFRMAHALNLQCRLTEIVAPYLKSLTLETRETSHLAIREGNKVIIIDTIPAIESISIHHHIGFSVDLHCSAIGKCLLFDESPEMIETIFSRAQFKSFTPATICRVKEFIEEVDQAKKEGYALDRGEFDTDVWCAAAPLRDFSGRVVAAIGLSGPKGRVKTRLKSMGNLLIRTSTAINQIIG